MLYTKTQMADYVRRLQSRRDDLTDQDLTTLNVIACSLKNDAPLEKVWVRAADRMFQHFEATRSL